MSNDSEKRRQFYHVHLMKTAGSTLRFHARATFRKQCYPFQGVDDFYPAFLDAHHLLDLSKERLADIHFFGTHLPWVVTQLLGIDLVTITVLREPVSRTISHLRHIKRVDERFEGHTLEQIYDDPVIFPGLIHNYQAKMFALDETNHGYSPLTPLDITAESLQIAKSNLAKVDIVGTVEHYGRVLSILESEYGWTTRKHDLVTNNAPDDCEVSAELKARIREDNALDTEFYEFANALSESRWQCREMHRRSKLGQLGKA